MRLQTSDASVMNEKDPLLHEVLEGLMSNPKTLPPELFYDEPGSRLFEQISALPEYYLTRAETALLDRHGPEIAAELTRDNDHPIVLIEPGCGSSTKAALLLRHLPRRIFVGIDVSQDALSRGARALRSLVPGLEVRQRCDDFRRLDDQSLPEGRRVAFFAGSTLGNFEPSGARTFLRQLARMVGASGMVLLGLDRWKDPAVLRAAYDDAAGVTAAFNRNALVHLATRFGARLDPENFAHQAVIDSSMRRVEMHLRARRSVTFDLAGRTIHFAAGESVRTEHSYKFDPAHIAELLEETGLMVIQSWSDPEDRVDLYLLRANDPADKQYVREFEQTSASHG
jgi:L-histidine N-alpha-methyltransferase